MKTVQLIRNYYPRSHKDFIGIDFYKAHEDSSKDLERFNHSGIYHIDKLISHKLQGANYSYYVDFSSILSTIKANKLQDFIFLNNQGGFLSKEKINKIYNSLYEWLEKENLGIFYHQDFIRSPKGINGYFSEDKDIEDGTIRCFQNQKNTNNHDEINLTEVGENKKFFTTIDIPLPYRDFTKRGESKICIGDAQKTFHKNLKINFSKEELTNNAYTYLFSIPLIGALSPCSNPKDNINVMNGQGGIFVFIVSDNAFTDDLIQELPTDILYLAKDITFKYLVKVGLELLEKSKKEAIKSAKAAIMARNMSHNLGSHVMSYLKQHLYSVTDIVQHSVLKHLIEEEHFIERINNADEALDVLQGTELPFLVGMGRFINYLQERQDFIATISTDFIPYFSNVNLKDSIFDELNPDYRHERHSDRSGYKPDNLLLSFIAKSEEFDREGINICFRKFNGLNDKKYHSGKRDDSSGDGEQSLNEMRQIEVNLPGGIIGRQAIFSIFENIIRNSAKHGAKKEKLQITFDILDYAKKDDKNKINAILSNVGSSSLKTYFHSKTNELYLVTVNDNMGNGNEDNIKALKKAIKEDYIHEDGSLKETNKGIKEIRISAAWLNGINDEGNRQIIDVISTDNNQNIQYVFPLLKPRRLAYIFDNNTKEIVRLNKLLREHNWFIYTKTQYESESNRSFDMIVFDNNDLKEELDEISHFRSIVKKFIEPPEDKKKHAKWCRNMEYECLLQFTGEFVGDISKIIIVDEKAYNHGKEYPNKIVYRTDNDAKSEFNGNIIYKTHYQDKKQFIKLENTFNNEIEPLFVEGISGHNSTDRLIRQEQWTKYWELNLKLAAQSKVAIIDERIFERAYNIESKVLRELFEETSIPFSINDIILDANYNLDKISNLIRERLLKKDIDKQAIDKISKGIAFLEGTHNLNELNQQVSDIIDKHLTLNFEKKNQIETSYQPLIYVRKNIFLYNILWDSSDESFKIIGLKFENNKVKKTIEKISEIKTYISIVGEIIIKEGVIDVFIDDQFKNSYRLISIHQGLLDKIYQRFNIKTYNKKNKEKKIELTNKLHDQMMIKDNFTKKGVIIHSGRSQPGMDDMPQRLPFVQYAALENAVFDCKHTLINLLTSARYEPRKYK